LEKYTKLINKLGIEEIESRNLPTHDAPGLKTMNYFLGP
jgi:hypothetical protein